MPTDLGAYMGPAAGVVASLLWTGTALCFTAAGRRLGAAVVNALRILLAIVWLGLTHRLLTGAWVPVALDRQVILLALSGLVGLSLGDFALFAAFVRIGPRLAMLVMTTAPLLAALFGWVLLSERIPAVGLLGMGLTIMGVAWVIAERPALGTHTDRAHRAGGVLLALIATVCQAGGSLLSKAGIGHGWLPKEAHLPVLSATLLRMFFAGVFVVPLVLWLRRKDLVLRGMRVRPQANAGPAAGAVQAVGLRGAPGQQSGVLSIPLDERGGAGKTGSALLEASADAPSPKTVCSARAGGGAPPVFIPRVRTACLLTLCGSIVGPYLGVWLSLVAFDRAKLGIAQTTLSLTPIFILPFAHWVEKERISSRAALGALLAVAGTALLFWQK